MPWALSHPASRCLAVAHALSRATGLRVRVRWRLPLDASVSCQVTEPLRWGRRAPGMAGCAPGRAGGPRWGPRGDAPPLPLSESFFLGGGGSGSGKGCQLNCKLATIPRVSGGRRFAFMHSSHPQILRVPLPECPAQLPSFISLGCLAKFNWITRNI